MTGFDDMLAGYDYELPEELIAQAPAEPRDSAGLAVLERASGTVTWTHFREIGNFLPPGSVLVLNETKVIPARLRLRRATGVGVGVLLLSTETGVLRVMADRKLKPGEVLSAEGDASREFEVVGPADRYWLLRPLFPLTELTSLLEAHGEMPLPPYIDRSPLSQSELKQRYQSVFARNEGSIAAPTASLHFTPELLASLEKAGHPIVRVTLHVNLGTFARLTPEQWASGSLHSEQYVISENSASALIKAKKEGIPIMAVGTTSARTLESAFDGEGRCVRPEGATDLFIREGYDFKIVDGLITNFHVPKSSLLMLVSAFAGREKIMDLYRQAVERRMRFFSFGDAMLIL